jgi:hypothetical protein
MASASHSCEHDRCNILRQRVSRRARFATRLPGHSSAEKRAPPVLPAALGRRQTWRSASLKPRRSPAFGPVRPACPRPARLAQGSQSIAAAKLGPEKPAPDRRSGNHRRRPVARQRQGGRPKRASARPARVSLSDCASSPGDGNSSTAAGRARARFHLGGQTDRPWRSSDRQGGRRRSRLGAGRRATRNR